MGCSRWSPAMRSRRSGTTSSAATRSSSWAKRRAPFRAQCTPAAAPAAPRASLTSDGTTSGGIGDLLLQRSRLTAFSLDGLQSVARPQRALLQRRDDAARERSAVRQRIESREPAEIWAHAGQPDPGPGPTEQAAFGGDQRGHYLVPEARPQGRPQAADAVRQTELDRLGTGPILAGKQRFFGRVQPCAAGLLVQS